MTATTPQRRDLDERRVTARYRPWRSGVRRARSGPLPNFLVIGATNTGTTTLHRLLRSHPQVFMPAVQSEFFAREPQSGRGIEWYRAQFASATDATVAVGEASDRYARFPRYGGVPKRVAAHLPAVRLIYVVKDPIERIRSHHQARVAAGVETQPIGTAIFDNPIYLCYSRYALQIEQYMEHFRREQLLVVTSEALHSDEESVMSRVYEFLDVDAAERPAIAPVPLRIRNSIKRVPQPKRLKGLEANVVRNLSRLCNGSPDARSRVSDTLPDQARERLISLLADEVRSLRDYLGGDFDGWNLV